MNTEILIKIKSYKGCKMIDEAIIGGKELPEAYSPNDIRSIKAIVLGCDPSNRKNFEFKKVFQMENESSYYFKRVESNLNALGLTLDDIYVENLVRNYMEEETGEYFSKDRSRIFQNRKINDIYEIALKNIEKEERDIAWYESVLKEIENNVWYRVAREWLGVLKEDLDKFDPERKIPIFLTSEYLIPVLVDTNTENYIKYIVKASEYYDKKMIINASKNKLGRDLIPLFRHTNYNLNKIEGEFKFRNNGYRNYIREYIKAVKY